MSEKIKRPNALAIHSVRQFAFTVPDLDQAEHFYQTFGLRTERHGQRLDLYAHGHPHRWGQVFANGEPKRIAFLSLGAYAEDLDALRERAVRLGHALVEPHPLSDGQGFWLRDPDGTAIQVVACDKLSPAAKADTQVSSLTFTGDLPHPLPSKRPSSQRAVLSVGRGRVLLPVIRRMRMRPRGWRPHAW